MVDEALVHNEIEGLVCPSCHGVFTLRNDVLECQSCQETMNKNQGIWVHQSEIMEKFKDYALSAGIKQYENHAAIVASDFYPAFVTNRPRLLLDAGSGDGNALASYAQDNADCKVFAVDADLFALQKCQTRQLQNLKPIGCSVLQMPFKDRYFEYANSIFMVEHMLPDALDTFLGEIYRVLNPGGLFVVASCTPIYDMFVRPVQRLIEERRWLSHGWTDKEGTGHVNLMTVHTMERLCFDHGFQLHARRIHYVAGRHKFAQVLYSALPQRFVETVFSTMYILTLQKPVITGEG